MAVDKKTKKKCCGKFKKKGKHCSSCPVGGGKKKCNPHKKYCQGCKVAGKGGKKGKKKKKDNKKTLKKCKNK